MKAVRWSPVFALISVMGCGGRKSPVDHWKISNGLTFEQAKNVFDDYLVQQYGVRLRIIDWDKPSSNDIWDSVEPEDFQTYPIVYKIKCLTTVDLTALIVSSPHLQITDSSKKTQVLASSYERSDSGYRIVFMKLGTTPIEKAICGPGKTVSFLGRISFRRVLNDWRFFSQEPDFSPAVVLLNPRKVGPKK